MSRNTEYTPILILPDDDPTLEELEAAQLMRPLEKLPSLWAAKRNPQMLEDQTL